MNFLDTALKYSQILNLIKIRSVRADLFYADGETDGRTDRHDVANGRFRSFSKARQNDRA